jgi:hypothetical protein
MTLRALLAAVLVLAGSAPAAPELQRMTAKGTFDVTITPQQADNTNAREAGLSRLSLHKRFHGALDATSHGEMLAIGDGRDAGAYVAIERITGTLDGRSGSFAMVHRSMLRRGTPEGWTVTIVPDSGTGALTGIEGDMTITIAQGRHEYELVYMLPAGDR